jgi:hypothetical protein
MRAGMADDSGFPLDPWLDIVIADDHRLTPEQECRIRKILADTYQDDSVERRFQSWCRALGIIPSGRAEPMKG